MYNKARKDGKLITVDALTKRRSAEAALYLTVDEHLTDEPMPQVVAAPVAIPASPTVVSASTLTIGGTVGVVSEYSDYATNLASSIGHITTEFGVKPSLVMAACVLALGVFILYRRYRQRHEGLA
jgi:hypothetical protein